MKPKFLPIIGLLILLAGPGYGGWLIASHSPAPLNALDIFSLNQSKTGFVVPADRDIANVKDLSQKLILLANPQLDTQKGLNLKLFGQNRTVNQYNYQKKQAKTDTEFAYDITFTFISTANRYCYINKKFYQLGDIMPDGGRISAIETNQVLIVKNNISEWVQTGAKTASAVDPKQKD